MIKADINPDGTLNGKWSDPVRISGEKGDKGDKGAKGDPGATGPEGPNGPIGITGVSMEFRYCKGDDTAPIYIIEDYTSEGADSDGYEPSPSGWSETPPAQDDLTAPNLYVWCTQGKKSYNEDNDSYVITWQTPFRISGLNGSEKGDAGDPGPVVYPAGIWNPNTTYEIKNALCPYVYYEGVFYILKVDYSVNHQPNINDEVWEPMEGFEAIYADVGVLKQALIGPAVFHGDYVYSQQGVNSSGTKTDYTSGNVASGTFIPNIKFNFNDGSGHLAGGALKWSKVNDKWVVEMNGSTGSGSGDGLTTDDVNDLIDDKLVDIQDQIDNKADSSDIPDTSNFITSSDVNSILNKKNYATKDQIISASDVISELNAEDIAGIVNGDKLIDGTAIADGSIATELIAANAVTTGKIAAGAITANQIKAGAVTTDKISGNLYGLTMMSHSTEDSSYWVLRSNGTARIGKVGSGITINSDGSATFSVDSIAGENIVDQNARDAAEAASQKADNAQNTADANADDIANLNSNLSTTSSGLSSLKSGLANGTTTISGNCITTGLIDAQYLDISVPTNADIEQIAEAKANSAKLALEGNLASGKTTISGGCIETDTLSANTINGGTLNFNKFNVENLSVSDSLIVGSKFATNASLNSAKSELNTSIASKADSSTVSSLSNTVSNLSNTVSNKADKSSLDNYATKTVAQQYVEDFKTAVGVSTTSGITTIDGGHIDASTLKVNAANIEGTLIIGKIDGLQSALDSKATTSQLNSKADSSTVSTLQNQVNNLPTDSDVTAAANNAQTNAENNITNKLKTKQSTTFINGGNIISGSLELSDYLTVGNISGLDDKITTITNSTLATTNVIAENLQVNSANIAGTISAKMLVGTISSDVMISTPDGEFSIYEYIQYMYSKKNYSSTKTDTWYEYNFDEHTVKSNDLNYIALDDGEYLFGLSGYKKSQVTPVNYVNGEPYYGTPGTPTSTILSGTWTASGGGNVSASISGDTLFVEKNGSGSISLKNSQGDYASIEVY